MGVIGPGFLNQVPTLRVYVWDSRPKVPDFGLERFGCGVKGLGLRAWGLPLRLCDTWTSRGMRAGSLLQS